MLILTVTISLMTALERNPPANVSRWLWAQLVYIPFVWTASFFYSNEAWQYALTYCVFTAWILYAVVRIAWDSARGHRYRLRMVAASLVLAATLAECARLDMHGQWAWVTLSEGFLLLWAGILTAFAGAHRPRWDLYVPLGAFWVLQGGFSLGWTIHGQVWQDWNWVVPPTMGLACFSYLAWRLKPASPHPRPAAR